MHLNRVTSTRAGSSVLGSAGSIPRVEISPVVGRIFEWAILGRLALLGKRAVAHEIAPNAEGAPVTYTTASPSPAL